MFGKLFGGYSGSTNTTPDWSGTTNSLTGGATQDHMNELYRQIAAQQSQAQRAYQASMTASNTSDRRIWELTTLSLAPHPAHLERRVALLMEMADSTYVRERFMAAAHADLPLARVIMMQDDPDPSVQGLVMDRIRYAQENPDE